MKTLYTGHITINKQYVYSFIYAETLAEAEDHLSTLLNRYVREQFVVPSSVDVLPVKVVSRPNGWNPPDGFYLPPTGRQYALKYPIGERIDVVEEGSVHDEVMSPALDTGAVKAFKPFMMPPG